MSKLRESREGETNINYQGLQMVVKKYNATDDIIVLFENGYETHSRYSRFKSGRIKNPFVPTVQGVGIIGNIPTTYNGKNTIEYTKWRAILVRSFSEDFKLKNPTYKNVTCCKEWLLFENFYNWLHSQENFELLSCYDKGFAIDKDILVKGNKVYSPDTCCVVPKRVNELFIKADKSRGKYPIGVVWSNSHNSFRSQCWDNITGKLIKHRGFQTPEDAFNQYKCDK